VAPWRTPAGAGTTPAAHGAEVGLSTGSLRHVFGSQAELLQFSMELVGDRVRARIAAIPAEVSSRERIARMISEILPLDAARAAEQEVWLACIGRSRLEPSMRQFVTQIVLSHHRSDLGAAPDVDTQAPRR
jgi:AcrR family transcriptional regulator